MNIIVFKPDYRPIDQEFRIEATEHSNIEDRKNIVVPVEGKNQHLFVMNLLRASYNIFNLDKETEFEDIKIRNYKNIVNHRNLAEYISSDDFQMHSKAKSFIPLKNLTSEQSETLDKVERKIWFKKKFIDENYQAEPLHKSPIISSTDVSGRYELTLHQLFDSSSISPVVFAVERMQSFKRNRTGLRSVLSRSARKPLLQSPVFYLQALDLEINYKKNLFSDPAKADNLYNYHDAFRNLGLQVRIGEYFHQSLSD